MTQTVVVSVGNTYTRLNNRDAQWSRDGSQKKIHKFKCFCYVVQGGDAIRSVSFRMHPTFSPQEFVKKSPPFETTQTAYGSFQVSVNVTLQDGCKANIKHDLVFSQGGAKRNYQMNLGNPVALQPTPLPTDPSFGVELELTTNSGLTSVAQIEEKFRRTPLDVRSGLGYTHQVTPFWKIVPDSSLQCSINQPNCLKFEMVSPILYGEQGLGEIQTLLRVLNEVGLSVNTTTGFHLHVDATRFNLSQLKYLCYNFTKYEQVFDALVPGSRRGSQNAYCKSNRKLFENDSQAWDQIKRCRNLPELGNLMNAGGDRYFKLNLQPLIAGRATIEFRQHSGTSNYEKVSCWIRLLMTFMTTCREQRAKAGEMPRGTRHPWIHPGAFDASRRVEYKFNKFFQWVVKDQYIKAWALKRYQSLKNNSGDDHCCRGCSSGGSCNITQSRGSRMKKQRH